MPPIMVVVDRKHVIYPTDANSSNKVGGSSLTVRIWNLGPQSCLAVSAR
jgi:hypothetical protein